MCLNVEENLPEAAVSVLASWEMELLFLCPDGSQPGGPAASLGALWFMTVKSSHKKAFYKVLLRQTHLVSVLNLTKD